MNIDAERLRGFLDCMHDEADERDKRSAQIRDIVKAAKDAGYDTKAIRKVFVRERMDEAERSKQDDLMETYEAALGGKGRALRAIEAGVPVGEACEANGVHRATVARARHVANEASSATPDHDRETGEIIRPMTADDLGDPLWVVDKDRAKFREQVRRVAASVKVPPRVEMGHPASSTDAPPDDLAIPDFLRRERVAA